MKRLIIQLAAGMLPLTAHAADLVIHNGSSWDFWYLYVSSTSDSEWGDDQLADDTLESSSKLTLQNSPCGNYDIKIVDEDGDDCTMNHVRICGTTRLLFTDELWTACIAM